MEPDFVGTMVMHEISDVKTEGTRTRRPTTRSPGNR